MRSQGPLDVVLHVRLAGAGARRLPGREPLCLDLADLAFRHLADRRARDTRRALWPAQQPPVDPSDEWRERAARADQRCGDLRGAQGSVRRGGAGRAGVRGQAGAARLAGFLRELSRLLYLGCSTERMVSAWLVPSRAVQAMDWPFDSPISAAPTGVNTETLPAAMS